MADPMFCQAAYCRRWAVEGHDLCDPHLEAEEEGQEIRRRAQPGYHKAEKNGPPKRKRRRQSKPLPEPVQGPRPVPISRLPRDERRAAIKAAVDAMLAERPKRTPESA